MHVHKQQNNVNTRQYCGYCDATKMSIRSLYTLACLSISEEDSASAWVPALKLYEKRSKNSKKEQKVQNDGTQGTV
jgi:hypothetical protein